MGFTTVGLLMQQIRKEKKITCRQLAYGVCSKQALTEIEADQNETDILMLDILMQRLGKSPDKFEMLLKRDAFYMIRWRDLIEETIYRGKRKLAEMLLQAYPSRTNVDQMYQYRMRASLLYHIDGNCREAAQNLQKAINITLPGFGYERMEEYMISTIEMENLLALERMHIEEKYKDARITVTDLTEERRHLEICMDYIERHFEDREEHAKIYSKCAWLLAGIYYLTENYIDTMRFCERGIGELSKNTMLYFMLPLLKLETKAQEAIGVAPERSKWAQCCDILTWLWKEYARDWYPTDAIFHNCYQREYHLDYEFIRAERKARKMTQGKLAEGVYENTECLSRVETGKVSPSKKTFEKLMEKLGVEKGRYNGYVVTDSFEVMEMKRDIDRYLMYRDYSKARDLTKELKNHLDMEIAENKWIIKMYEIIISKCLGEITAPEALEGLKKLAQSFYDFDKKVFSHIPTRNEVLLINNICVILKGTGQKKAAAELYKITLQKIESSEVCVKYRYRSYALVLNNHMNSDIYYENIYKGLQNELLCGKAMELPLCLNNILHRLTKEGISKEKRERLTKAVYYMSDLFGFKKEKDIYGEYLVKQGSTILR